MILNINGLSFSYKSNPVLNNIDFSLEKGEILAILGPNGVGKTTLLKCINSILRIDKGSIIINEKEIQNLSVMQIAKQISYVAQSNDTCRVTAFDAILLGRNPHLKWKTSTNDIKKVNSVIKKLNIEHLALKYLNQMSGGELQKVSIARAFVQETELLLLDEPTSNLDLKNLTEVMELIKKVVKEHNVAAIMTMHDLNTALRYADKYIFLKEGEIYGAGEVEDIKNSIIEEVYQTSVELIRHNNHIIIVPKN